MHFKKTIFLLMCAHIAFGNDNKTYFTTAGINPFYIGSAILSGIFLGCFFMNKVNAKKNDTQIKNLEKETSELKKSVQSSEAEHQNLTKKLESEILKNQKISMQLMELESVTERWNEYKSFINHLVENCAIMECSKLNKLDEAYPEFIKKTTSIVECYFFKKIN